MEGEERDGCKIKWQLARFCRLLDVKGEEAFLNVLGERNKK